MRMHAGRPRALTHRECVCGSPKDEGLSLERPAISRQLDQLKKTLGESRKGAATQLEALRSSLEAEELKQFVTEKASIQQEGARDL